MQNLLQRFPRVSPAPHQHTGDEMQRGEGGETTGPLPPGEATEHWTIGEPPIPTRGTNGVRDSRVPNRAANCLADAWEASDMAERQLNRRPTRLCTGAQRNWLSPKSRTSGRGVKTD